MKSRIAALFFMILILLSCTEEPVEIKYLSFGQTNGLYIACEGNFLYGNATISYYDTRQKVVYNEIFHARNLAPLGDVAQSLGVRGDRLFVVVNNSGKVVAVDRNTIEFQGVVKGLLSPRAIHFVSNDKAYISDMMSGKITVINPATLLITGYVATTTGKSTSSGYTTENFIQIGDDVFVTCWVSGHLVLVIDTQTDTVVDSISVPFQPNRMVVDCNGKLWVQTDGEYFSPTDNPEKPALVRIDPRSRTVEEVFRLKQSGVFFTDIRLNPGKDTLLYMAGDLFKMPVDGKQLPDQSFISTAGHAYYSLGVDPVTGDIYLGDAIDYSRNGLVYRFSPAGIPVDTFMVGVCPGDFLFNY